MKSLGVLLLLALLLLGGRGVNESGKSFLAYGESPAPEIVPPRNESRSFEEGTLGDFSPAAANESTGPRSEPPGMNSESTGPSATPTDSSSDDAAASDGKGGESLLRFRYWMVPQDKIDHWPWGGAKYYPVAVKLFEKWIDEFKSKEKILDEQLYRTGLAELHLSARLEGDSLVGGKGKALCAAEFFDRPFLLDPCSLSVSSFVWDDGEEASVGVYRNGLIYLAHPKEKGLLFDWSLRGKSDDSGRLVFDFSLVSSPVTEILLEFPDGLEPLLSNGMAEDIGQGEEGMKKWMIRPGGSQNFRLTLIGKSADEKTREQIGVSEHLSYRLSQEGTDVVFRSVFDNGGIRPESVTLVLDKPLLPTALFWKFRSGETTILSKEDGHDRTKIRIRVPEFRPDEEMELVVTAFAPYRQERRLSLAGMRIESDQTFWKETDIQLVVERPLAMTDFETENGAQVFNPYLHSSAKGDAASFRLFTEEGRVAVFLSEIRPDIEFSSGSEVFYDAGEIGFETDLLVQTAETGMTRLSLELAENWKIETVEAASGAAFWTVSEGGEGGSKLIISLKTPLSTAVPTRIEIAGRYLAEWSDDVEIEKMSPIDLRKVLRGDHLLALRSEFPYKVVLLDSRQKAVSAAVPDESVSRRIFQQLPLGTIVSLDSTSAGMKVRFDKTAPAYVGKISGKISVTRGGVKEDWNIHCVPPTGVRVDRVLVAFSSRDDLPVQGEDSPWKWDLASEAEGEMTVSEFVGPERRQMKLPQGIDIREIRLATSRSIPFDIHVSRDRKMSDKIDIPLILLPETANQSAEIGITSRDMIPIQPNVRRMRPLSAPLPPADDFETSVGHFSYLPQELASAPVSGRPVLELTAQGGLKTRERGWCRYFRLESQFDPDGTVRNHLTCLIENAGRKTLRVTLPSSLDVSSVFAVWSDGRRTIWYPEEEKGDSFNVVLPDQRRYVTISLEYRDQRGPLHLKPHLVPRFPALDIPILSGDWVARTPPEYASYDSQKKLFRPFPVIQTILETTVQTFKSGDLSLWQDVGAELFGMKKRIAVARKKAEDFLNRLGDPETKRSIVQKKKEARTVTANENPSDGTAGLKWPETSSSSRKDVMTWRDILVRPEILSTLSLSDDEPPQIMVNRNMMGKWRIRPTDEIPLSDAVTPTLRATDALEASGLVLLMIRPNILYLTTVEEREGLRSQLVSLGGESIWLAADSSLAARIAESSDSDIVTVDEWISGQGAWINPWRQSLYSAGFASMIPGWNASTTPIEASSGGILVVNRYRLAVWKWFIFLLTIVATWRGPLAKSIVLISLIGSIPVVCGMVPPAAAICLSGALWGGIASLAFLLLSRSVEMTGGVSPFPEMVPGKIKDDPDKKIGPSLTSALDESEPGFVPRDHIPGADNGENGNNADNADNGMILNGNSTDILSSKGENADDPFLLREGADDEMIDIASDKNSLFPDEELPDEENSESKLRREMEPGENSRRESGRVSFFLVVVLCALSLAVGTVFRSVLGDGPTEFQKGFSAGDVSDGEDVSGELKSSKNEKTPIGQTEDSLQGDVSSLVPFPRNLKAPSVDSGDETKSTDYYRVFVPYDERLKKVTDGFAWIPEELHRKLFGWIQTQENLENPWRLTHALYEGTVNYNNFTRSLSLFHLKATFTVETESSRSVIRLPMMPLLPDGGAQFDRMPIDPVFLQESGEILFEVHHSFPGKHSLELTLMPPPFGAQKTGEAALSIPRVPDSRLQLTVPIDAPAIQVFGALGEVNRSGDQITADLGPTSQIVLKPQNQPGKIGEANVDVDQLFLLYAASNQTTLKGEFRVHVYGGKIDSLYILNDPRYALTQCSCDEVGLEPTPERDEKDPDRVRIAFKKSVTGDVTLRMEFRIRDFGGIGQIRAPRIRVGDAKVTRCRLALFDSPSVEFEPPASGDESVGNLDAELGKWSSKEDGVTPVALYDLTRISDEWKASIRLREGRVVAHERIAFYFRASETKIDYQAVLKTSGDLFRLSFRTPEPFVLDSVTVHDAKTESAEAVQSRSESGECHLFFDRPLRGEYRIHLTGSNKSVSKQREAFPLFFLNSSDQKTTEVCLGHDRSLCLDFTPPASWSVPPANENDFPFGNENVVSSGCYLVPSADPFHEARFSIHDNHPKVEGEIQTVFFERFDAEPNREEEMNWEILADFSLNVHDGELDHLDIELDEAFTDSILLEPDLPHETQKRDNKNRVLRIIPETPIRGPFSFRFRCETTQIPETLRLPRLKFLSEEGDFSNVTRTLFLPTADKVRGVVYSWETENLKLVEEKTDKAALSSEKGEGRDRSDSAMRTPSVSDPLSESTPAPNSIPSPTSSSVSNLTSNSTSNSTSDSTPASPQTSAPAFKAVSPQTPTARQNGTRPSELYFPFGNRKIFPAVVGHLSGLTKDDFVQYEASGEDFRATFSPGENALRVLGMETGFFIRKDGTFYGQTVMDVQIEKGESCVLILPKEYEILLAEVDGIPVIARPLDDQRRRLNFFHEYPVCRISVQFYSPTPYRERNIRISGVRYLRQIFSPVLLEGTVPTRCYWTAVFESDGDFTFPCHIDQNKTGTFNNVRWRGNREASVPTGDAALLGKGEWKRPVALDQAAPIFVRLNLAKMVYMLNLLDLTVGSSSSNAGNDREKWFARWFLRWQPCRNEVENYFSSHLSPLPFSDRLREAIYQKISPAGGALDLIRKKDGEREPQAIDLLREASRRSYQDIVTRYDKLIEETGLKGAEERVTARGNESFSTLSLWLLNHRETSGRVLFGLTDSEMGEIEILKPDSIQYHYRRLILKGLTRILLILFLILFIWKKRFRRFLIQNLPGIGAGVGSVWMILDPGAAVGILTGLAALIQSVIVFRRDRLLSAKRNRSSAAASRTESVRSGSSLSAKSSEIRSDNRPGD